jgi:hypothetical protein
MIHHLNSMFSSETNTSTAGPNTRTPLSQSTLDSFHGALSDAVSSTMEKFGIHPSDVKISITPARADSMPVSTGSGGPVRLPPPVPGNHSTGGGSSTDTSAGATNPFLQASISNPYKSTAPMVSTDSLTESISAPQDAQQAFDDAYWAAQPPAVQALRTMQNPEERTVTATQLAAEGYSIDVPIMVWGWDPSITTAMRQADGYTWVPSAMQNPVEDAPGLSGYGNTAGYNPNNPPAGSIAV